MLDNLKQIHKRDLQDALGIAEKQWQQLEHEFEIQGSTINFHEIKNVVFAGMGGSALAGQISKSWPGYEVPFEICREYSIPSYVNSATLFIASSYSGNTEETISALNHAQQANAQIAIITSGGKLEKIAKSKNYPLIILPHVSQPRYGVFYSLKALITILGESKLINFDQVNKEIIDATGFLHSEISSWLPTVPANINPTKLLALELMGKSPVIYSGPVLFPAAYKWKISINENAKTIAWCNQIPEFNHNEFLGWTSHPIDKPYAIVDLRSNLEHQRIIKRFEVTERLLSGKRPRTHIVNVEGKTKLEQLLWAIVFGDFVSLYLALLNGINPTPVNLIEKFKISLDK